MTKLVARRGDITRLRVDMIANAANARLVAGGGVDGAIHAAAGPELQPALDAFGGCPTGEARLTPGFGLRAKWIAHAVGPVWQGGDAGEAEALASCYRAILALAGEQRVRRLAVPAISTGVYGYPVQEAAHVAIAAVRSALAAAPDLREMIFCCIDPDIHGVYARLLR